MELEDLGVLCYCVHLYFYMHTDFVDGDLVSPRLVDNRRKRAATSQLSHLWPEGKVNYIIGTGPTGSVYTGKF